MGCSSDHLASVWSILLFISCYLALSIAPVCARAHEPPKLVDADGTIYVPALTLPPSNLSSREFKQALKRLKPAGLYPRDIPSQVPDVGAPRSEWDKYQENFDRAMAGDLELLKNQYPVDVVDTRMAGVHVAIVTPKWGIARDNRTRVLIELHGGSMTKGFSIGLREAIPVASISGIKTIVVDYRGIPEYRYPAANEDIVLVYRELLHRYNAEKVGIFGCSWGGKLTAQSVAWFQAESLPRPGAVGIFCSPPPIAPMLVGKGGDSQVLWGRDVPAPILWYMEGVDTNDPRAYPGSTDSVLAKFPPTLLLTGTRAFEMSATVVAHARFLKLGVDSSLYIIEGMAHGEHMAAVGIPETHDALTYVAEWFQRHL